MRTVLSTHKMRRTRWLPFWAATVASFVGGASQARDMPLPLGLNNRPADAMPSEFVDIGIDDRAGAQVPTDVRLVDENGASVLLKDILDPRTPTVLVLAYYSCPMLCTLVLNGVSKSLKTLAWTAGSEYRVVTVSIDPRDTPEIARGKQETYLEDYGRPVSKDAWRFLTGTEDEIRRLAQAVGFSYAWDEKMEQYVHAAGGFVLTPEARISRTLYGIEFNPRDLRLAIAEASDGRIGTAIDKVLLFCFHYDPQAKGYVVAALRVMKAGGILTAIILGLWLGRFWRRERKRAGMPQEL